MSLDLNCSKDVCDMTIATQAVRIYARSLFCNRSFGVGGKMHRKCIEIFVLVKGKEVGISMSQVIIDLFSDSVTYFLAIICIRECQVCSMKGVKERR